MAIIYKVAHNTSTVLIIASFINDNLCYPVLGCSNIYTHKIHTIIHTQNIVNWSILQERAKID